MLTLVQLDLFNYSFGTAKTLDELTEEHYTPTDLPSINTENKKAIKKMHSCELKGEAYIVKDCLGCGRVHMVLPFDEQAQIYTGNRTCKLCRQRPMRRFL